MSATLETWIFACSLLFLAGMLMVAASAVPSLQARFPRLLFRGFGAAALSFGLVLAGALLWR
jgi:hypothetical protein